MRLEFELIPELFALLVLLGVVLVHNVSASATGALLRLWVYSLVEGGAVFPDRLNDDTHVLPVHKRREVEHDQGVEIFEDFNQVLKNTTR